MPERIDTQEVAHSGVPSVQPFGFSPVVHRRFHKNVPSGQLWKHCINFLNICNKKCTKRSVSNPMYLVLLSFLEIQIETAELAIQTTY